MPLKIKTDKAAKGVYVIAPMKLINCDTYAILEKKVQRIIKNRPKRWFWM